MAPGSKMSNGALGELTQQTIVRGRNRQDFMHWRPLSQAKDPIFVLLALSNEKIEKSIEIKSLKITHKIPTILI